ncbi:MAG: biotin carboxyl carrier domain-containing protein [Planctomycetota bacterium]|nr:MAG: biotin carboxyl carrier domain-containing protein [Planctomycetota bacterium]
MDGIFYRRPKPDQPPFVEQGQRIRRGDTVGLIEVMKTFYPVVFEGELEEAEVGEVVAEDGREIQLGQRILALIPRGGG